MMNKTSALTAISSVLLAVGCYSPEFGDSGGFKCEKDRTCPQGYTCNTSTFLCEKGGDTPDLGPGTDTTADGGVTPNEGGPPPPPNAACKPLGRMEPVGTNLIGNVVASRQFGLYYDALEEEFWASFKDAPEWDSAGLFYAFRKARTATKWDRQGTGIAVGGSAGAHSDIIAFIEERDGTPTHTVIAAYQSAAGLNAWMVLQPLKITGPDSNPMTVHHVASGGYSPQMVRTSVGIGAVHAVIDEEKGLGEVWYVTGEQDVMSASIVALPNDPGDLHGIGLSAVGSPDVALQEGVRDLHIGYYMRTSTGAFDLHYASRELLDVSDPFNGWGYYYSTFESAPLVAALPPRLGFSLALDGGEAFQTYVFQDTSGQEDTESLRFGLVEFPGERVPFPVPAGNPALAMGGGQVAIFALDGANTPHLIYRPAGEGNWSTAQAIIDPDDSGAHAWPGARLRALTTHSESGRLRIVVGYVSASHQLMVGEFECSEDAMAPQP